MTDHRNTASGWHGGQSSPLYAYASTGSIVPGVLGEVDDCLQLLHAGQYDSADIFELEPELLSLRAALVASGADS